MRRAIPPIPQYAFMAWCLVKYRDNFTFTFILQNVLSISHSLRLSGGCGRIQLQIKGRVTPMSKHHPVKANIGAEVKLHSFLTFVLDGCELWYIFITTNRFVYLLHR
jgi:hypothetical protein